MAFFDSSNFHIHHGTIATNVWKKKSIKNNKKFFSKNKVVNNLALIRNIFVLGLEMFGL